jgi:hypothetical protein
MCDLVYWCPYENRVLVNGDPIVNDYLGIFIYTYDQGNYYLTYNRYMESKEINVFVNSENRIYGIGAKTDKNVILKFIEWYRKNGEDHYNKHK